MIRTLIVEPSTPFSEAIAHACRAANIVATSAHNLEEARGAIENDEIYDGVLVGADRPAAEVSELVRLTLARDLLAEVVLFGTNFEIEQTVRWMRSGVSNVVVLAQNEEEPLAKLMAVLSDSIRTRQQDLDSLARFPS